MGPHLYSLTFLHLASKTQVQSDQAAAGMLELLLYPRLEFCLVYAFNHP